MSHTLSCSLLHTLLLSHYFSLSLSHTNTHYCTSPLSCEQAEENWECYWSTGSLVVCLALEALPCYNPTGIYNPGRFGFVWIKHTGLRKHKHTGRERLREEKDSEASGSATISGVWSGRNWNELCTQMAWWNQVKLFNEAEKSKACCSTGHAFEWHQYIFH